MIAWIISHLFFGITERTVGGREGHQHPTQEGNGLGHGNDARYWGSLLDALHAHVTLNTCQPKNTRVYTFFIIFKGFKCVHPTTSTSSKNDSFYY